MQFSYSPSTFNKCSFYISSGRPVVNQKLCMMLFLIDFKKKRMLKALEIGSVVHQTDMINSISFILKIGKILWFTNFVNVSREWIFPG